jgi:hypothetical protein
MKRRNTNGPAPARRPGNSIEAIGLTGIEILEGLGGALTLLLLLIVRGFLVFAQVLLLLLGPPLLVIGLAAYALMR